MSQSKPILVKSKLVPNTYGIGVLCAFLLMTVIHVSHDGDVFSNGSGDYVENLNIQN